MQLRSALWLKTMKSHFSVFIFLFMLSAAGNAENLKGLSGILESKGVKALVESLNIVQSVDVIYLELDDKLKIMGSDKVVTPRAKWKVVDFKKGNGLQFNLDVGYYYFESSPTKELNLDSCAGSGATSGSAFKQYGNGTVLVYSWSCGSIGCSYNIKFGEKYSPCL